MDRLGNCKCRICNWKGTTEIITAREMMYGTKEEFEYFVCDNCQCLQIREVPKNLGTYYGDAYYSYEDLSGKSCEVKGEPNFTRVLDVGSGSGAFLFGLAKMGFVNLSGCDPFIKDDLEYANGIKIYKKEIHEMEGEYDNIYFNDSFEHVQDPHEVMESARRLLAQNGIIRIALPVYPNIAYDMFGADWYQLDAPRHIFLHSINSMRILAESHGLLVAKIEFDSNNSQIVRSFLYSKGISFWKQTSEIVKEFFSAEELTDIDHNCKVVNENQHGDHAVFYLVHKK